MSTYGKTSFISRRIWYSIPKEIRKAILSVLPHLQNDIVSTNMFISTLENELRIRGEHELAAAMLEAGK